MTSPESLAGTHIGPFRLVRFLARGAMGLVYKAYDTVLLRTVALKIIPFEEFPEGHRERALRNEACKRLIQEAKAAGRLNHPNVVTIYSYGSTESHHYICMEYVSGRTLSDVFQEHQPLEVDAAVQITKQVLRALTAADAEHIVHRDIKPSNIMITSDGAVKVMDFGIAKLPSCASTSVGTILGTPYYMSPEQVAGRSVDIRSDLFSLGVVLYQMLTGTLPFEGESTATVTYKILHTNPVPIDSLNAALPRPLATILSKALQKDPALRYQSPAEMLDDLEVLASSENLAIYARSDRTETIERRPPLELEPVREPQAVRASAETAPDAGDGKHTEEEIVKPDVPIPTSSPDEPALPVPTSTQPMLPPVHRTHGAFRAWMAAHRTATVLLVLIVLAVFSLVATLSALSLLGYRLNPTQSPWIARLTEWMPAPFGSYPQPTRPIEGSYIVDGVNPSGHHYQGTAVISKAGDYYTISWNIANQVFYGNAILRGSTFTVHWAGAGTSGIMSYTQYPNGALQGTWANGMGAESMTPLY